MTDKTLNTKTYGSIGFNSNGQAVWSERSAGIASGFSYLTGKTNAGTGKADSTIRYNLSLPIVATGDSSCACEGELIRTLYARIEFTFPQGTKAAERTDIRLRVASLIATAGYIAAVDNLAQDS